MLFIISYFLFFGFIEQIYANKVSCKDRVTVEKNFLLILLLLHRKLRNINIL